ncbi:hypothetical protein, partial [Rhodovulum sulfidophilum]|uniref:hypothetical protein n=1 Tax=Rhodovulum sulfidophilum TaxID=35806 RepID=UPI001F2070B9
MPLFLSFAGKAVHIEILRKRCLTGFCDSRASGTVSGALGGRLDFPAFLGLAAWGAVVSGLKSPA